MSFDAITSVRQQGPMQHSSQTTRALPWCGRATCVLVVATPVIMVAAAIFFTLDQLVKDELAASGHPTNLSSRVTPDVMIAVNLVRFFYDCSRSSNCHETSLPPEILALDIRPSPKEILDAIVYVIAYPLAAFIALHVGSAICTCGKVGVLVFLDAAGPSCGSGRLLKEHMKELTS